MGGGAFSAVATGVFDTPKPDPYANMPRSLALSLPAGGGGAEPPLPPLPDPLEGGTATAPSPSTRIPYADGRPDPRTVEKDIPTTLPFTFNTNGYKIVSDLPENLRPWRNRPTAWANISPTTGNYHLNAQGVYLYYPNQSQRPYFGLLRNPRWFSYYCRTHRIPAPTYHHHITLWQQLHWHTNSVVFAHQMDMLVDDFPSPGVKTGSVIAIGKGTHTLYKVDTTATGDYDKVNRISAGAYKGYWIGEAFPNVFLRGEHQPYTYRVQRTLTIPENRDVIAYKFGTDGSTGTTRTMRSSQPYTAQFDRRAVVNGRAMCRISAGELAGYWVPANQVVTDGR
ncbi:hypothetical protein QWM81_11655 [Streptomyces ficellus]|uniref:Uncharacterized protein n=1 Tax=Streptomyces ficellus TaxID=1977088 RepID=A0ABT7Z5C5_9ACTN|nr:hypothetical protein [Streptomyces ficellus]MDN3294699.1 hypothetical protein [Streptomyces ficellus]